MVHWISPRPVLFLHGADDTVTPTEQSIRMWELAEQPKDLVLITGTDYFPLGDGNQRTKDTLTGWLDCRFPLQAPVQRPATPGGVRAEPARPPAPPHCPK